jgi:hypothetical protein
MLIQRSGLAVLHACGHQVPNIHDVMRSGTSLKHPHIWLMMAAGQSLVLHDNSWAASDASLQMSTAAAELLKLEFI